ncbi:MAG: hypothetical protein ABGX27_05500 [Desulfurobacteriaceae bacterium]
MMVGRGGFTIMELLIVTLVGMLVLIGGLTFFSESYKQISKNTQDIKSHISIDNVIDLLVSDLKKAGYGIADKTTYPPVEWDEDNKTLTIRYVDYDKDGCESANFTIGNDCSYEVKYVLKNQNLERVLDKGADGEGSGAYLLDSQKLKIEDFEVQYDPTTKTITFKIVPEDTLCKKKEEYIETVECLNCN